MDREFFMENRKALYNMTEEKGLLLLFSGHAPKKTNDENYPFFADRNYMYFTGVHQENTILMTEIYGKEQWEEALYILPPDLMAERWTGRRIKPEEVEEQSGIRECASTENFRKDLENRLMNKGFAHGDILSSARPPDDSFLYLPQRPPAFQNPYRLW